MILFELVFVTLSGYQNFCFFSLIFLLFHQFSYQEYIFLMSSKTSNILKTNPCSKETHTSFLIIRMRLKLTKITTLYKKYDGSLFGNTFQENSLLYRNLSIDLQSAIIDWFICLFYLLFYLFLLYKGVYKFIALVREPVLFKPDKNKRL